MNTQITKTEVVLNGAYVEVTKKTTKQIVFSTSEYSFDLGARAWLMSKNFSLIAFRGLGYAYAWNNELQVWYKVDLRNLLLMEQVGRELPEAFVLGQVFSESEGIPKDIKVERKTQIGD